MAANVLRAGARWGALALIVGANVIAQAQTLMPLDDRELSTVSGRDGVSFDFSNFSLSGDARITYTMPAPATASLWLGHPYMARSDDAKREFTDPYRLDIFQRRWSAGATSGAIVGHPSKTAPSSSSMRSTSRSLAVPLSMRRKRTPPSAAGVGSGRVMRRVAVAGSRYLRHNRTTPERRSIRAE